MINNQDSYKKCFNPTDNNDLITLVEIVIASKIKKGFFSRWSKESLLSEGWIQIEKLKKTWQKELNVSFSHYVFMYLGNRIFDGMSSFEEGMSRLKTKSDKRWTHRALQFQETSNECNNAFTEDVFAQHKETIFDRLNACGLTEREKNIVHSLARGIPMKTIGNHLGISESRVCQCTKEIRRLINE